MALYKFQREFWDEHKMEDIRIIHYTMFKPWDCNAYGDFGTFGGDIGCGPIYGEALIVKRLDSSDYLGSDVGFIDVAIYQSKQVQCEKVTVVLEVSINGSY